ncbi:MAG: DUF4234 domain-containing protein [Oscillospiraceae bacterium]
MRNRNIALCIVLSIVTCGIYDLYWWACLADEGNIGAGVPGTSGIGVVLLSFITCGIYGLVWAYGMGEKINMAKAAYGMRGDQNLGIAFLILNLFGFGIVTNAIIQNEFNKMTMPQ